MKAITLKISLLLTTLFVLSGCVVGRRTISLNVPSYGASDLSKGDVYLGGIEDQRFFQNNPRAPSTPSIDGDVNAMSAAEKAKMVGRQRGGFGNAMGDVALEGDDTVMKQTRALLEEGLKRRGYRISQDPNAKYRIDTTIKEFWAWFTPGAFTVKFEARVNCDVKIDGNSRTEEIVVSGYGLNHGQIASDANWALAYERAFNDFLENFESALEAKGY